MKIIFKAPSVLAVAAVLAIVPAAHGQLLFERKLVEINAGPDADLVTADFHFTVGEKGAVIQEYEASCSCLEAKISDGGKLQWKPGEKGTVKGLFKMGTFKGVVDKPIVLRIKDQPHAETLTVRVNIPIIFEVDPPTLFWDQGSKPTTQKFKMKVHDKVPIKVTDVSGTNDNFKFELKTIKEGWEYELEVTPMDAKNRAFGLIRIRTDSRYKRHQSAQGFVVVRRPKPAAPKAPPKPAVTEGTASPGISGRPTPPPGVGRPPKR